MMKKFTNAELIVCVQFNTNDRPYLMVSVEGNKVVYDIVKKKKPEDSLIISKLTSMLGIKNLKIDIMYAGNLLSFASIE